MLNHYRLLLPLIAWVFFFNALAAAHPDFGTRVITFAPESEQGGWLAGANQEPTLAFGLLNEPGRIIVGHFEPNATHVAARQTVSLPSDKLVMWHAADFNGDGLEDLAVGSAIPPRIIVLTQGSDRSLTVSSVIDLTGTNLLFMSLVAADINNDGVTDIAFTQNGAAGVCFGLGNGAFQNPSLIPQATGFMGSLTVTALPNDAGTAIIVARGRSVFIYMYSDGSFTTLQELTVDIAPGHVRAGNWISPDQTDLLVVGSSSQGRTRIDIFRYEENAFVPTSGREHTGVRLGAITTPDIDRDGHLDIVFNGDMTGILFGKAESGDDVPFSNEFVYLGKGITPIPPMLPPYPQVVDLDGDDFGEFTLWNQRGGFRAITGAADRFESTVLVVKLPENGPSSIGLYPPGMHAQASFFAARNSGQPAHRYALSEFSGLRTLTVSDDNLLVGPAIPRFSFLDANSDGRPDLLSVSRYEANTMSFQYMTPSGGFSHPLIAESPQFIEADFLAGDLDGDGQSDIIAFTTSRKRLVGCFGEESGVLDQPVILEPASVSSSGFSVGIGDVTGNGRDELVAFQPTNPANFFTVYSFDGTRQVTSTTQHGGPLMAEPSDRKVFVSDLSGDGLADVLLPTIYSLAYFESINGTSFASPRVFDLFDRARLIRSGDLNGDGFPEVVVSTDKGLEIHTFDSARGFQPLIRTDMYANAKDVLTLDFDSDGREDLIIFEDGTISILFGRGVPGCAADFSHDGRLDFFDIARFMVDFQNEIKFADLNKDERFDFFDIASFLRLYREGCP